MKNKGYIYFLFNGDELVYIGQTTNIISRLSVHFSYAIYTDVRLIECQVDKLKHYERRLIKLFKPKINKAYNPGGSYKNCPWKKGRSGVKISSFPQLQDIRKQMNDAKGIKTYSK